jgi:DNA-binding NarL/FixJ family response regulator
MPTSQPARPRSGGHRRGVMLLLTNALDCDALALWCKYRLDCESTEWETDLDKGLERCRVCRPRLLALDPSLAVDAIARATAALREGAVGHLLVLDSRPIEARLKEILREPSASYVSRAASPHAVASAISEILQYDRRVFDPSFAARIRHTKDGYQLDQSANRKALGKLSMRERQVLRLLAEGKSVRRCAEALGLSQSTIDNHKSRLMKKLGIHRASELTILAIREGLIDV